MRLPRHQNRRASRLWRRLVMITKHHCLHCSTSRTPREAMSTTQEKLDAMAETQKEILAKLQTLIDKK